MHLSSQKLINSIHLSAKQIDNTVRISIRDEGIGMSELKQKELSNDIRKIAKTILMEMD